MTKAKKHNYRFWYLTVLIALVFQIAVYYWFTCYYK